MTRDDGFARMEEQPRVGYSGRPVVRDNRCVAPRRPARAAIQLTADITRPDASTVRPIPPARIRLITAGLFLASVCVFPGCKGSSAHDLIDATHPKLQVGDSWQYQTRPGEETSTLTVVKIDSNSTRGLIVHISLNGLRVKNARIDGGISETISHMPFSANAIEASVTSLRMRAAPMPSFEAGYQLWRGAFARGKAGVFTASIRDAIDGMEKAMQP